MTEDSERRLDIRTYNQQKLTEAFMQQDSFSPGGSFDRLGRSFIGIMDNIGEASSALFTGTIYVFTCLKAGPVLFPSVVLHNMQVQQRLFQATSLCF